MNSFNKTIRQFLNKSEDKGDLKKLFLWFNSEKGHSEIKQSFEKEWNTFKLEKEVDVDSEKIFINIKRNISRNKTMVFEQTAKHILAYAAVLILLLTASWFVYSVIKTRFSTTIKETLTYTSVVTENGQHSKVILPDSSVVWLNSGTTITYPSNFTGEKREVILEGQAFFQVKHNRKIPFVVQSNGLEVNVLGTKFDVTAYPKSKEITVVLESGRVKLTHSKIKSFEYDMKPGELASFNLVDTSMNITKTDALVYSSWKEGKLVFRNAPMNAVVEKLERWYNIKITVKDIEVFNSIFTGTIQNESYENIFRLIKIACPINYEIIHNYEEGAIPEIILYKN